VRPDRRIRQILIGDPLGWKLGLPNVRRGEAVRDRGRLEPVRRAELAQDVRDMNAGRPDADHQGRRDLAVGVAAGDEGQDLRLARREAEDLPQALGPVGRPGVRRSELQPSALGEQLELPSQGRCSDPSRDDVCLLEWPARLGAGGASGDQRLGLAPAAVGGERRALEPLPGVRGVGPQVGACGAVGALVLGLGQGVPAVGVRGDRRGLGGGAAGGGDELLCPGEPGAGGVGIALAQNQTRSCAV
jgi:hypothetical protein